jgi:oxygen-independent coproporphyrinogen-3 oxidase
LGPAAASFIGGRRWTNEPDIAAYLAAIEAGTPAPCSSEQLTGRRAMAETLMLGLRLIEGVSRSEFAERFGQDPVDAFAQSIGRHRSMGTLIVTDSHIRIAPAALFVSDSILADIVAEA